MPPQSIPNQHGFTLLEVLITLIIIAGARLGTAGMQAYGIKLTQGSQLRSQAVYLAVEMLERIDSNNAGAKAGNYIPVNDGQIVGMGAAPACDTSTSACAAADLALQDMKQFETKLVAQLPSPTAQITCAPAPCAANPGPWTYTVDITWVQTASTPKGTKAESTVQTTETLTYSVHRTVYDRNTVL